MEEKPSRFVAKVLRAGQITIPDEMRKIWVVEENDLIEMEILHITKAVKIKKEV